MDQEALAHCIVDNRDDGLFRVNRQAVTDPQILAWEQRRVFEQSWIYAGHTSEIPKPGDGPGQQAAMSDAPKANTLGALKATFIKKYGKVDGTKLYNNFLKTTCLLMLNQIQHAAAAARKAQQQNRQQS